jgi:hypothetical protein
MKEPILLEAILENVEAVVDASLDNEILKNLPVIGTFFKFLRAGSDIRDRVFAAKILKFLQTLNRLSDEEIRKMGQRIASNPEEAIKVGETIVLVLEKITALDKAEILARLFIAYIFGYFNADEFRRISDAVDQAFIDDIKMFLEALDPLENSKEPFMRYLSRTGLTMPVGGWWADPNDYKITDLGKKLIDAYKGLKY